MITFQNFTYQYPADEGGKSGPPVLDDFSWRLEAGQFGLLIGPSGSGKSTLLRAINGLVPSFYGGRLSGQVRVAGSDPVALGPRGMSQSVGFVFQEPESFFVMRRVEEELSFGLENFEFSANIIAKRIEEVLDLLDIVALRGREVNTLSGGEKQRVAIASVLALQPQVVVLDEPTSQLDPLGAESVLAALQQLNTELGLTVLMSEHRLERVAGFVDSALQLPSGFSGTPDEVLARLDDDELPQLLILGRRLGWSPLPLNVKQARRHVRQRDETSPEPPTIPVYGETIVDIKGLKLSYPTETGGTRTVLKDFDLQLKQGEFVALMGRNGSGKSSLLKVLTALLRPERGNVKIFGQDVSRLDTSELVKRLRVGYVPQNPGALLFNDTLTDELAFTLKSMGQPRNPDQMQATLERLGLTGLTDRFPRDLSVGERQRAALASILVAGPRFLILDEPTRGLDYPNKRAMARLLAQLCREEGLTVLMATHDVELVAEYASRVVLLGDGNIVADGSPRHVLAGSLAFATQINKLYGGSKLTLDD